jgi:fumarylacetoacetate (FAA) hydrolase
LVNDLTHRHLLTEEYAIGVGFYRAKPLRPFAPFAIAPADLGDAWADGLPQITVKTWINGELLGAVDAGRDGAFRFPELIAHMAQTRPLAAGTLVGSGTVANRDPAVGFGCLAEQWAVAGRKQDPDVPFLAVGDQIRMEAFDQSGRSLFGRMEQHIVDTREESS